MPTELTAEQAAARLQATDTLGIPLGPGQPPAFLRALGERDDWTDLRVYGALLAVLTELFNRPGVHYLSGFYGPLDRALRDGGADVDFVPADFRRFGPLLRRQSPRVMATVTAAPDADGWCSLALHAGGTVDELRRAGADPDRLLIVEASDAFPRTYGLGEHRHALHVDEIDILVRSSEAPLALPGGEAPPSDVDRAIAENAVAYMPSGVTLQTGIGSIPNQIATLLAEGEGGDFGLHSEMFTDGCMRLHRAGKIANAHKGQFHGVSVTTFAFGSAELYEWLDDNREVAFLPVEVVNAPHVIADNERMVTINGALAIDIHGQVVADTIDGGQFSGIGGAEDFVAGAGLELSDRSLICLPSTYTKDGELRSRIVPWFGPGAVITTPRHHVDVIVTEHGTAELEGLTVRERGEALAAIADPRFRDGLLAAAERAAKGRSPVADRTILL
ncbi:4-hydroxybutyrate CoA-transferase [Mycobacterium adipatum]|jgi:acyl-CoA hydrolase|uniref:4-hydroxybutyrate CoA-transferase n=1 Tax=Mycobacterium adipatum TaxID=1682113 RepID=A0A172UHZ1_9MYCO|nr:acetyl-CoA hydrolase/transferase C-terminal domain-containing protein [Mycobacterium adipatum]ANE78797.1 4-hydroxybutyrate CoA-transferase [Mycobacterium adipatum]